MSSQLKKDKGRAPAAQPAGPAVEVSTKPAEGPSRLATDWQAMEPHPAAGIFPMMSPTELEELGNDIKERGLLQPVVVIEEGGRSLVLDGRNRLEACRRVGVEPRFQPWDGKGSPVEFVLSANLHRRQLDTSQRAMVAARAKKMIAAEGKSSPEAPRGKSRDHAAALHGVSPRLVDAAFAVVEQGVPDLVRAVESREASVFAAAEIAKLSEEQQTAIIKVAHEKDTGPDRKKVFTEEANKARASRRSAAAATGAARRPSTWRLDRVHRAEKALKNLEGAVPSSLLQACLSSIAKLADEVARLPSPDGDAEVSP